MCATAFFFRLLCDQEKVRTKNIVSGQPSQNNVHLLICVSLCSCAKLASPPSSNSYLSATQKGHQCAPPRRCMAAKNEA